MTKSWLRMHLLVVGLLCVAGIGSASAFPSAPIVTPAAGVVPVACNPGTPHCVTANPGRPVFCSQTVQGCTIDGGLGSECQGGGTCGTGPSGPPGNPYFPYGNQSKVAPPAKSLPQPAPVTVK